MLKILNVDHVGIRVSDKTRSMRFYEEFGYRLISDTGFQQGHPVIMQHPSGLVLNILGPATEQSGVNILMDIDEKHPGYTHVALHIESVKDAEKLMEELGITITGRHKFNEINTIFIRDPDRNVVELVEHSGVDLFSSVPTGQHH